MRLYLLRHGEAEPGHPDENRHLTEAGTQEIRRLASILNIKAKNRPTHLRVSPLTRARETADLFCRELHWSLETTVDKDLVPSGNPARVARNLIQEAQTSLVVGHNPHLEMLLSYLLSGQSNGVLAVMNTGSLACLEFSQIGGSGGSGILRFLLSPNLFEA